MPPSRPTARRRGGGAGADAEAAEPPPGTARKTKQRAAAATTRPEKPLARLLSLAVAKATPLSLLLLLLSALAPLAFPLLERKLDFEESGPLAGSARPNIRTAPGAEQRFQQAAAAAEALMDAAASGGGGDSAEAFFTSLSSELESRGLEVSRLTEWRSDWPYGRVRGRRCAALHAVLRAPRGDGKESVAIVTPVALGAAAGAGTRRSLAGQTRDDALLALTAAHAVVAGHLRDAAAWLAKDVVWVVPDASCGSGESVEAWLAAYHRPDEEEEKQEEENARSSSSSSSSSTATLRRRRPFVRAGVIQQALVLQADSSAAPSPAPAASVSLAVVGADGQLPKTDFYLLLRYYCTKWVRLPGCAPPGYPFAAPGGKLDDNDGRSDGPLLRAVTAATRALGGGEAAANKARAYARRLGLMLRFAGQQARGVPTGPHAPFKWRNTDALTITFHGGASLPPALQRPPLRTRQAAELLELAVRSCSVLIERLHHAFFLYALSSPDHFVSVERYIGPACALIGVMVLQAAGARQRLTATTTVDEEEQEQEEEGSGSSWTASARVAVLLPLLCGALGWSLRAGLEAASLGGLARLGGGSSGLAALAASQRGGGAGVEDPPSYEFAEALRLLSLAAGVAVLAWAGLAEVRAALEDGLLLLLGGRGGADGGGGAGKQPSAKRGRPAPSSSSSSSPVDWRMVKVLVLCGAAVPLAGMACSNWALAHAAALACAPLTFAEPCGGGGGGASSRRLGSRARLAAVILCSPPGLAALAGLAAALVAGPRAVVAVVLAGGGGGERLRWLVLEGTSWATWSFAWCVYVPVWVASAWIVSLPK